MAYVNPSTQSIKTCFQSHYSLPYFQREYKWESRHFTELLNDIQNAFILHFDPAHGRRDVASYPPYFLGSIISASAVNGKKPLIDGQQRLTSVFLILAYLERFRKEHSISNALDLSSLLGSVSYGAMDYAIEFSVARRTIFDRYLDCAMSMPDAIATAGDVTGIDDGDRKILDALQATDRLIDTVVRDNLAYFIDYVVERVMLIDISVDTESEAHRVFVTMNDRGLRLGPIDLLKGFVLSKVTSPQDSFDCHSSWVSTINKLRNLGAEEDSLFFRNLFRARWALTIRGKAKGDPAGDFDLIGDAYHRWFEENLSRFGLTNSDDIKQFIVRDIARFAEMYAFIKEKEDSLIEGFEAIYFNAARRFGFQTMIAMASVQPDDSTADWQEKIKLSAQLIDLILSTRTIEGKENNYDNLRDISFQIAKEMRNKDVAGLLAYVRSEWSRYSGAIVGLPNLRYAKADRSDILFILVRIASYLELKFQLTNKVGFTVFWRRDRGTSSFDIEHLLKERFDPAGLPVGHAFVDAKDYAESRNLIGALTLLPRHRNRSLQDAMYRDKLGAYSTENVLTQTFSAGFYLSNPNVKRYLDAHPELEFEPIIDFTKADIATRGASYTKAAEAIWAAP